MQQAYLNIDGAAGTTMPHFDGTAASIDFLKYDLVNLAYHLPNIESAAVIGVGGGRDVLAAHLFGVKAITGVELNRIFIDLHLRDPFYSSFSNLRAVPGLTLHVDDARSWFAATDRSFDLIQMSMIDTWAATSAGAFTLSENGLYTLEGWRAFTRRLTDRGVFTVSRWYNPGDVNESGRMIALAVGTMIDAGAVDPRRHVFVATGGNIATLVLARTPLTSAQLTALRDATARLGFDVLVDPDREPRSDVLRALMTATDRDRLDRVAGSAWLDLTVPTDERPFFFNQLRLRNIPAVLPLLMRNEIGVRRVPRQPHRLDRARARRDRCRDRRLVHDRPPAPSCDAQCASRSHRRGHDLLRADRNRFHVCGDLVAPVLRRLSGTSDLCDERVPVQPDSFGGPGQPRLGSPGAEHGAADHGVGGTGVGLSVRRPGHAARHLRCDVVRWIDGAHRGVRWPC